MKLEGLYRHASTHAAGVVISDRPLVELVPLYRDPRSDMPVTQFNMKHVELAGLVKFDFLGLKTLTVLDHAVRLLHEKGVAFDLVRIPLDDEKSWLLFVRLISSPRWEVAAEGFDNQVDQTSANESCRYKGWLAPKVYLPGSGAVRDAAG